MKHFVTLLLSIFMVSSAFGQLQKDVVVLNELYTDPNKNTSEFLEFYNSSLKDVNLDDYTILLYYETTGNTHGFYVIDLPSHNLTRNGYYVLAPTSPFNAQVNVAVTPDVAWATLNSTNTDAYLKKYQWNGSSYTGSDVPSAEINNIIYKRTGSQGQFHVLIYDGEQLVNFFVGGYSTIPTYVTTWPSLTIPWVTSTTTTTKTIHFSALISNNVESVISNTGSDNGYRRTRDGQCGTWVKSSSGSEHTPKYTNGAANNVGSLTTTTTLAQAGSNVNALSLAYRISATANANVWPVTVRVVNDYGTDDGNSSNGFEVKLPEGPLTPYNSVDEEEAVNTGSPSIPYTYPIPAINSVMGAAQFYLTSPVFTPLAYPAGYTGTRTARAFHVFYQTASGCFDKVDYAQVTNAPVLPVNFKSFTAKRNKQQVHLNWQTASECNNAGFVVERNINGTWSEVTYVATKAPGGNSEVTLDYQFIDQNSHKGITQYRIRQNDLSEKTSYSTIRSVQGEAVGSNVVIYPNPSFDGRVQIVFADASASRHIVISDLSGRIVRQLNNVNNSSVTVEGLNAGLYTARVINQATGESTLQKFVIQQK